MVTKYLVYSSLLAALGLTFVGTSCKNMGSGFSGTQTEVNVDAHGTIDPIPPLEKEYILKDALEKQKIIFAKIESSKYSTEDMKKHSGPAPQEFGKFRLPGFLDPTFKNPTDEFKEPKTKLIHTFGVAAKVKFVMDKNPRYTGLFASGALGIIRLSKAALRDPVTPGLAVKLFVNGQISQNIFAMPSLDGQGSNQNFFANDFETKLAQPTLPGPIGLGKLFEGALIAMKALNLDPTFQSVREVSEIMNTGEDVLSAVFPFSLVFKPSSNVQMDSKNPEDFRIRLINKNLSKETILYEVHARAVEGGKTEKIGTVVLDSVFLASEFGDKSLYFRHTLGK